MIHGRQLWHVRSLLITKKLLSQGFVFSKPIFSAPRLQGLTSFEFPFSKLAIDRDLNPE